MFAAQEDSGSLRPEAHEFALRSLYSLKDNITIRSKRRKTSLYPFSLSFLLEAHTPAIIVEIKGCPYIHDQRMSTLPEDWGYDLSTTIEKGGDFALAILKHTCYG
jgi:hypothetical protein